MNFTSVCWCKNIFYRADNDAGVRLKLQSWKVRDRGSFGGGGSGEAKVTVRGGCGEWRRTVLRYRVR